MLTYEEFKTTIMSRLPNYLPKEFKNSMDIKVETFMKRNMQLDGVTVSPKKTESLAVSPVVYLQWEYQGYLEGEDLESRLSSIAEIIVKSYGCVFDLSWLEFDNAKERIIYEVVNTIQNKEMLAGRPHREVLDLSYVYKILVDSEDEMYSVGITHTLAEKWGIDEAQLFKIASKNTVRMLPLVIRDMEEVVRNFLQEDDIWSALSEEEKNPLMWIISNEKLSCGAAAFLYEGALAALADKVQNDLYILPSSVHEVIAVLAFLDTNVEDLVKMVVQINAEQVELEERLSNQVYYYNRQTDTLSFASDISYSRLDNYEQLERV